MKPGKWISRIVMAAFFISALLYFASYTIHTFRNEVSTTVIHSTTVEDSADGTGLVFRQETPVKGSGDLMEVLPAEGDTVAKGETLAVIYQDKAALEQHQALEKKKAEREALHYVLSHSADSSDNVELSKNTIAAIQQIRISISQENISSLNDQIQALQNIIYRQDYTYKGSETVTKEINALTKEIKKMEQSNKEKTEQVTAEAAGTFSTIVDGYETVLTPNVLNGLTPSKLSELKQERKKVASDTYLGKIITGKSWYFVANLSESDVKRMHKDLDVTVRFDDVAGDQPMTVVSISDPVDGKVAVVFSSNRHLSDTSLLRSQSVSVIYASYSGFRVPKEALHVEKNQYYLYRLSGAQLRRVEVKILMKTDDYFVVSQVESTTKDGKAQAQSELEQAQQIRDGDQIVIRGINLYDGKVIQ